MALLLWANLTGIALFLGVAFTAQLEARRVGDSGPTVPDQQPSHERTDAIGTSRTQQPREGCDVLGGQLQE